MEKILPMSPAKMFAYMKERESKVEQLEVQKVCSSTRDLFDGGECEVDRLESSKPKAKSLV